MKKEEIEEAIQQSGKKDLDVSEALAVAYDMLNNIHVNECQNTIEKAKAIINASKSLINDSATQLYEAGQNIEESK